MIIKIELRDNKIVPQQVKHMKKWIEMMFVHSSYAKWVKSIDIT